jgi:hypothetical protein
MAFGTSTFTGISGGVSDLFQASADQAKAQYDLAEQQEYELAGKYAGQNAQITAMSTAIQQAQLERQTTQALGKTQAGVAGAGFAESGSAIDLLRSGAQQGSIMRSVANEQGLVTEAGYEEQQASYNLMANAAGQAASAEETAAKGADIGAFISFAAAAASPFTGGATTAVGDVIPGAAGDAIQDALQDLAD